MTRAQKKSVGKNLSNSRRAAALCARHVVCRGRRVGGERFFELNGELVAQFLSIQAQLLGLLTEFAQLLDSFVIDHAPTV